MMKNKVYVPLLFILILGLFINGCQKEIDVQSASDNDKKAISAAIYGSREACGPNNITPTGKASDAIKSAVKQSKTIFDTDFLSAGVGGMRGVGNGNITLPATFSTGTVTQAFLYWHGVTNSSTNVGISIMVNSTSVTGTNIGVSSSNCWPFANSQAYRADVTSLVNTTGPGNYSLAGFGELNPNGASLIVFYNDGNNSNNRDVVIFDGNDSNIAFSGITGNPNAPADPLGWDVLLSGINYKSGNANIQLHVGDGQTFADAAVLINAAQLAPEGGVFQGTSAPGGGLWDIKSFDVTSSLSPGPNSLNLTTGLNSDCLSLIAALIDLPAGAAPPAENMKVSFDFSPKCCPNIFVCADKGTVAAAILGKSGFDVSKIDVSTVKLNGVSPVSSVIKDVATPFEGILSSCTTCSTSGPDQKPDLSLVFENQAIHATLGNTTHMQCIKITITGKLLPEFGGTSVTGEDFIQIKK